ncbi:MAG: DUF2271 domain-containing protein [Pseudomonadales bacterium]|nr:DUF2271 domain-containing protein [Pseudomonadales bacterium]
MPRFFFALLYLFWLVPSVSQAQETQRFEQHYEGVLGTTLDLTFYGPDSSEMEAAANAALVEITRLDAIFSSKRSDSEVNRLNRERVINGASTELLDIIELCARWENLAQGRFSCKLGRIITAWDKAEQTQVLPDRVQLQTLATASAAVQPTLYRGSRTITLPEPVELDLSGIAAGYILDRTFNFLHARLPDVTGIKLDSGGDAIYWGHPPLSEGWRVDIANPLTTQGNDTLATLSTHNGRAIMNNRHVNRFRSIGGQQYSHILVPGTGWPVAGNIGVITVAKSAVTADVATTAMTMQTTKDATLWASTTPDLDALIIDSAGNHAVSNDWATFIAEAIEAETGSVLALNYTLPIVQSQTPYSRPYVAIWVTDVNAKPRKNLLLLGKDQRWARENTRWWRQVGRARPELIDGIARPTRAPGEYRLTWDGHDEDGKPLPTGNYTLHVEAARQDGGHNYQTLPFTLGTAQTLELPGEGEIGRLVLEIK